MQGGVVMFQSTVQSYVCPALNTGQRQSVSGVKELLKGLVGEKSFLYSLLRTVLVFFILVLGTRLWMGTLLSDIEESIISSSQEYQDLTAQNKMLQNEKKYLLLAPRIKELAAQKLGLFEAEKGQIRYLR